MSLTALPSGLQPAYHPSADMRSIAHKGVLLPGTTVNIFKNQPVYLFISTGGAQAAIGGLVVPAGQVYLAPVTTVGQAIWGVFAGCEYFDITGFPQESNFWPSGQAVFPGTVITAFVWEDPAIIYTVQTDGSAFAGAVVTTIGDSIVRYDGRELNLAVASAASGSSTVGLSQMTVAPSTMVATTVQGQFQIDKVDPTILNQADNDTFLQLQVRIANSQIVAARTSI